MKKFKFRRFGISTGAKVQQEGLRNLAKSMAKDPGMLIPKCLSGQPSCSKCKWEKTRQRLLRIQRYSGNLFILNKLAKSGKQLERGYAAMLLIAQEEKPIMFVTAKLPGLDVSLAPRGKVKKEVLIGLQHFDDEELRLLAYSEMIKKKVHLYSSSESLFCTGLKPHYPDDLMAEVLRATGYSLRLHDNSYKCSHLAEGGTHSAVLRIGILSADRTVELCHGCASDKKNLYVALAGRVLCREPDADFFVKMEQKMNCAKGDNCALASQRPETSGMLASYRSGELSDRALLDSYSKARRRALSDASGRVLVIGDRCFEEDSQAFIGALKPSEVERKALTYVLSKSTDPVVADTATVSAILSQFWDKNGQAIIFSVTGDQELARKFYAESQRSEKSPSQVLREADAESKRRNVLASLPTYKALGKIGSFSDEVARQFRAHGKAETLRIIEKGDKNDTKIKSVSCGFYLALDSLKGKEWLFTKEELDYGKYLATFAKSLLIAKPENYTEKLQSLLTASGSGENAR